LLTLWRPRARQYHAGSRPDALLQTGEKTPYEHALEAKLAAADMNAMRTQQLIKMDPGFWNDMHKMTSDYFASQAGGSDCGVPGGCVVASLRVRAFCPREYYITRRRGRATDKRAAGCIIPVSGDTSGLKCCTSCCQVCQGCDPASLSSCAACTVTCFLGAGPYGRVRTLRESSACCGAHGLQGSQPWQSACSPSYAPRQGRKHELRRARNVSSSTTRVKVCRPTHA